jgi:hypothetical protein
MLVLISDLHLTDERAARNVNPEAFALFGWCRRVRSGKEWLSVESFLERQLQSRTSHGICEGCAKTITVPRG